MTLQSYFPGLEPALPVRAVEKPAPAPPPPKKGTVPRRDLTAEEAEAVKCLKQQVRYTPASWDKRFARELLETSITEGQAAQVWRMFHRYRRQITHPAKERLLEIAQQLAAPDNRTQKP